MTNIPNYKNITTDWQYANIIVNNKEKDPIPCVYDEGNQTQPILMNQQDFMVSVNRMKIPTSAIPLFIFEDNEYFISFGLGLNNTNILPPVAVNYLQSSSTTISPYNKAVNYYTQFLDMVNRTLQFQWDAALLVPAYAVILAGYVSSDAPYFRLADKSEYIELVLPTVLANNPATPFFSRFNIFGIKIYMSTKLFNFFNGFGAFNFGSNGVGGFNTLNYGLVLEPNHDNLIQLPAQNPQVVQDKNVIQQNFGSLAAWQTITRLFMTTTMPLQKENIFIRQQNSSQNAVPVTLDVFTDFEIPATNLRLNEYIYFNPSDPRYVSIKDTGALYKVDLRVYIQFRDLSYIPLMINPLQEFEIKLQFKRRKVKEQYQNSNNSPVVYNIKP